MSDETIAMMTGTVLASTPTDTEQSDVVEYTCDQVNDVGGRDEAFGYCRAPAVLVHRLNDTGKCYEDLPFNGAMPLAALGHYTDYYWNGVGPY